jgi:hypothetical protein
MISSKTIINSLLVVLIISGIVLMIFITIPYFFENPETRFLLSKISVQHKSIWQMGFKIHVWSSIFVLIFGFLQFLNPIRIKYPKIHRLLGKLYVGLVLLVSSPGGMIMGFYGNGGLYAKISFVLSAFLWILSTYLAYKSIRQLNFQKHVYWMSLSFGLCLSALSLRFYVLVLPFFFHLPSSIMYALVAWLSWIPNLILAHYYAKKQ